MIGRLITLATGVAFAGAASAGIVSVDWPGSGSGVADGTATISGANLNLNLSHVLTGLSYSLDGSSLITGVQSTNIYTGVYNFNVGSTRTDVMCVELTQRSGNATYDYKKLNGFAGWLAAQMAGVTDAQHGAALALATWEVTYDSTGYNGGGAAGLNLGTGRFQFAGDGNVLTYAQQYLTDYAANNRRIDYTYYRNPVGGGTTDGRQDFIGTSPTTTGSVPGPIALAPFLVGLISALSRRRR